MSRYCEKCAKPIAEDKRLCPECEARAMMEQTIPVNPVGRPEAPQAQSACAPKPAAKPERPIVTEFPIVHIPPREAAIAKEKAAARNKLLMTIGIILAALICVSLTVFGIFKLATHPAKDESEPDVTESVITEAATDESESEDSEPKDSEAATEEPDQTDAVSDDKDIIYNTDKYKPYAELIDTVCSYEGNDEDISSEVINEVKSLLEQNELTLDDIAYDLIELTDNELYELVIFKKAVADEDEVKHIGEAPEILCILSIDNNTLETKLSKSEGNEYYLIAKENDDAKTVYSLINHFFDVEDGEKYNIFSSLNDLIVYKEENENNSDVTYVSFTLNANEDGNTLIRFKGKDGQYSEITEADKKTYYTKYPIFTAFDELNMFEGIISSGNDDQTPETDLNTDTLNSSNEAGVTSNGLSV